MNNEIHGDQSITGERTDIVQIPDTKLVSEGLHDINSTGGSSGSTINNPGHAILENESSGGPKPPSSWQNPLRGVGVSQIRYEFRCKICQLSGKAPTLYKKVHELIFIDRMSWNAAMNEVNTYIKNNGLQLTFLNMANMSAHFNKHIQIDDPMVMAIDAFDKNVATPAVPDAVREIVPFVQNASKTDIDDFKQLDFIRQKMTTQLEKLESQLEVIDPKTNKAKLDKWALELFTKVVKETRACINDLNDMRKSERLMNSVVQALLDRLTFAIIPQLLEEYGLVAEELAHSHVQPEIIKRIDERLRKKTAEIIANTARSAVVEVQRQFKLR